MGAKQSDAVSGSASMCLFSSAQSLYVFCAFNPFTFKVVIDMEDPITISLIVLGLFCVVFFFPSLCFLLREVPLAFVVKLI